MIFYSQTKAGAGIKRGFTLLELIIVIIIVSILATVGFLSLETMMEKARTAEAKSSLGTLRKLELTYFQEYANYSDLAGLNSGLPSGANASFYFSYACNSGTGATGGDCTATRLTAGGKYPQGETDYTISLSINGTWTP